MQDKFGVELEIGDLVFYAGGSQSDYKLYLGTIIEFKHNKVKIKDSKTNIKKSKLRNSSEIINANYLKEKYPEQFI